ncbi:MAG: RHS repeat protein [Kangiella sp.]|nr:RHS repeat protein [Kangiella sp.]
MLFTISDKNNQGKACYTRKNYESQYVQSAKPVKNGYKNGWGGGWLTKDIYSESPQGVASKYINLLNLRSGLCFIDDRGECALNNVFPHSSAEDYFQFNWVYQKTGAESSNYTIAPNIEYHCPDTDYNTYFDKYSDGYDRHDLCFKVETSSCTCDRNLVGGECQIRDLEWSQTNRTVDPNTNALLEVSDENNQGLSCGRIFSDDTCAAESEIFDVTWAGNPINCGSGKKVQVETDYRSSAGSLSVKRVFQTEPNMSSNKSLKRVFTLPIPSNVELLKPSYNLSNSNFWRFNIPMLHEPSPGIKVFEDNSGRRIRFMSGETVSPSKGSLIENESGYVYRSLAGTKYHFDTNGKLTRRVFRNGQFQDYNYINENKLEITDNNGNKLILSYKEGPLLFGKPVMLVTKVTDPEGNIITYNYDSKGMLTEVSYPDDNSGQVTRRYNYLTMKNGDKGLSSIIDEHGDTFAQWSYDTSSNQAILSQHYGGAEKVYITYGAVSDGIGTSTVSSYRTSYNKLTQTLRFKLFDGAYKPLSVTTQACSGCVVGTYSYEYDANGFLSQATSPEGDITKFSYNLRGLLESKTEAFGTAGQRTVTTTWHGQYKLPLTVDEPQRLTTYTYDANGNLLSRSVKDKETNETRTVSYTYNSVGQVLTADGPRTDVSDITTYEYDASGNLTKVINALGHETLITSHDAHGKPLSVTDPNGTVTTLTYHPRGWLTSITTDGLTTSYDYDKAGQLTAVTMANGIVLNYEYDAAHRLVAIADANGNRIEYTLDNYGNRTRTDIKDSSGAIQSYAQQVFNDLGQLKQTLGANSQVNDFDYDAEGKPVQSEDALDNPTSQQFDELDRLQKVVDPALGETEFDYDIQDRLTSVTDATGKTTSYQYNAFGDLLSMTSPDTGTSTMTYDSAGNVLTATDARNITAIYSYDALNRVTSIDYPGTAEDITFTYDSTVNGNHGLGRLTQVTDESGSTSYEYDAKGQLVAETRVINGLSFTTGYQYDAAGLITQVIFPSGRTVDYQRNNLGQVIAVTTTVNGQTQTLANNISYLPFGPLTSMTYGNGKVLTQTFDQDYRLTSKHTTGLQQLSYGYTLRNNINSISDLLDSSKSQAFSYDALGRLTDASGDYGTQSYTFDPIGNRLSKTQYGVTDSYTYSSTSHQLQSVGTINLTYDAIGNTLTKGDLTFTYNQVGRLATASKTGMNATYGYNAQGQRVKKTVNDGTSTIITLYHYDQAGQLIAETDGQGNLLKEYLYLDGQRLATVDNGALYYIHTDHLGSPLALTDSNGTVQWKGSYDPYGNVSVEVNNLNQNQRFPGQYADEETGLHYNYFRDYDPEIGRYLQSDPVGLDDGANTYLYSRANPVNRYDPNGLTSLAMCANPANAAVCVEAGLITRAEAARLGARALSKPIAQTKVRPVALPKENTIDEEESCSCPPIAEYGPYYRYELDSKYVIQAYATRRLYGRTPRGGIEPTVQAYKNPLSHNPPNKLKFCTPVEPVDAGVTVHWYKRTPGVMIHDDETVKIPIHPLPPN